MNTLLLVSHIILLTVSLALTATSAGMAVTKQRVWTPLTIVNMAATVVGLLFGVVLLASNPIDAKCLVLLGYLVSFVAVELYVKRRNQVLALSLES
jgi:hypothetical protein